MVTILWVLLIVAAYLVGIFVIGIPMANKSHKVWVANYPNGGTGGIWGYLLFPDTSSGGKVGFPDRENDSLARDVAWRTNSDLRSEEYRRTYVSLSATFWPLRIVWTIAAGVFFIPAKLLLENLLKLLLETLPNFVRRFV